MREMARWLLERDDFAVCGHISPDGDSFGSAIALTLALLSLGKRAFAASSERIPHMYEFLPWRETVFLAGEEPFAPRNIVHVDTASPDRVGVRFSGEETMGKALIDHHDTNPGFDEIRYIDGKASSTGELIAMLLDELGVPITAEIAVCLYTAISTDTGNFQFSNTTPAAMRTVARLVECGLDISAASASLFRTRTLARTRLLGEALHAMRLSDDGRVAVTLVTREMMARCEAGHPDTESIVNYLNEIEGVEAAAMLEEREGAVKISLRSAGRADVSKVAQELGGGGHRFAAGATVFATPEEALRVVEGKLLEAAARGKDR